MSQKPCRVIRKAWKKLLISHPLVWRQIIKLNTDKCHLLISGHKYEHRWTQIGKDMVWEENEVKLLRIMSQPEITCSKLSMVDTRTRRAVWSELSIKTPERSQWSRSGVFIVNFEHISHLVLVFLLLALSR